MLKLEQRGRAALAGANPVALVARRPREHLRRQLIICPALTGEQADAFAAPARAEKPLRPDEDLVVADARAGRRRPPPPRPVRRRRARALRRRVRPRPACAAGRGGAPPAAAPRLRAAPAAAGARRVGDRRSGARNLTRLFGVMPGGRYASPVSDQYSVTGGMLPRAGKSHRTATPPRRERVRALALAELRALDARRAAELQRPVGRTEDVDAPVANQARAEVEEAAPVERQIEAGTDLSLYFLPPGVVAGRVVAPRAPPSQRSQSSVSGTFSGGGQRRHPLRPAGAAAKRVDFGDVADLARPDDLGRRRASPRASSPGCPSASRLCTSPRRR